MRVVGIIAGVPGVRRGMTSAGYAAFVDDVYYDSRHSDVQQVPETGTFRLGLGIIAVAIRFAVCAAVSTILQGVLQTARSFENVRIIRIVVTFTKHFESSELVIFVHFCLAFPLYITPITASIVALYHLR